MSKLRVDKIAAPIVKDEFTGSVHFDGSGDRLIIPTSTDLNLTGDFTIEYWVYINSVGSISYISLFSTSSSGSFGAETGFFWGASEDYFAFQNKGTTLVTATMADPTNAWYHIAVTRSGSTTRMFFNGNQTGSTTTSWDAVTGQSWYIGDRPTGATSGNYPLNGYISNFRICKGHAVYTSNFTPPTRELEVHKAPPKGVVLPAADNLTVLLACQSSTDATLDSSGRHTITANGDVHAQSTNPGLLRRTLNLTTVTENTGAVFFDGSGDYLKIGASTDFSYGNDDFTVESWIYPTALNAVNTIVANWDLSYGNNEWGYYLNSSNKIKVDTGTSNVLTSVTSVNLNVWTHIVYTRQSGTHKLYINGVLDVSSSTVYDYSEVNPLGIGGYSNAGENPFTGYISNLRICKGHAVYKSQFIPPTRELEVHGGPDDDRTVLLACYDGENIFADKSGRHTIVAYGDRTSSPTPTATDSPIGITTFNPGLTRNVDPTAGPTFQGGAGFTSQNWLTLPKGTTTERYAGSNSANPAPRGLRASGQVAPNNAITNTVDSVEIATTGDALDFGDLITSKFGAGGIGSPTRGLFCGGGTPTRQSAIDYFTISTRGNGQDFGDIFGDTRTLAGATGGNATRGLTFGGATTSGTTNVIGYVTIATTGDAKDFGDCTKQNGSAVVCSPTRAVSAGGDSAANGSNINTIDFVTIQSMGNSLDFGDLLAQASGRGVSSITRGLFSTESPAAKRINYVTIATTGNAVDFGDLISNNASGGCASYSSLTRGCFAGLKTPTTTNTIEYFTIPTLGDALNFGDLTQSVNNAGGCSNGHGGLG